MLLYPLYSLRFRKGDHRTSLPRYVKSLYQAI